MQFQSRGRHEEHPSWSTSEANRLAAASSGGGLRATARLLPKDLLTPRNKPPEAASTGMVLQTHHQKQFESKTGFWPAIAGVCPDSHWWLHGSGVTSYRSAPICRPAHVSGQTASGGLVRKSPRNIAAERRLFATGCGRPKRQDLRCRILERFRRFFRPSFRRPLPVFFTPI